MKENKKSSREERGEGARHRESQLQLRAGRGGGLTNFLQLEVSTKAWGEEVEGQGWPRLRLPSSWENRRQERWGGVGVWGKRGRGALKRLLTLFCSWPVATGRLVACEGNGGQ